MFVVVFFSLAPVTLSGTSPPCKNIPSIFSLGRPLMLLFPFSSSRKFTSKGLCRGVARTRQSIVCDIVCLPRRVLDGQKWDVLLFERIREEGKNVVGHNCSDGGY